MTKGWFGEKMYIIKQNKGVNKILKGNAVELLERRRRLTSIVEFSKN